jgi:hypothetical protein
VYWAVKSSIFAAAKLQIGEHVQTRTGTLTLQSSQAQDTTQTVYNLEIYGEHNYLVQQDGLWVHNDCLRDAKELAKRLNTTVTDFHYNIKKQMKKDFSKELKKLGANNPDIGINKDGNVLLKNVQTKKTVDTGVSLEKYKKIDD